MSDLKYFDYLLEKAAKTPFATSVDYNSNLEQIEIILKDCSYRVKEINDNLSLMIENHNNQQIMGAIINCNFLRDNGFSTQGIHAFVDLLKEFFQALKNNANPCCGTDYYFNNPPQDNCYATNS